MVIHKLNIITTFIIVFVNSSVSVAVESKPNCRGDHTEKSASEDNNTCIRSSEFVADEQYIIEAKSSGQQKSIDSTIGEEPPEDTSKLFLRNSEVLLKPTEIQISAGLDYSKNDSYENLRLVRIRNVSIPVNLSVGITERMEFFASVPVLYSQSEYVAFNESVSNEDNGFGDLTLGFSYKLKNESQSFPSLTGSFSQRIPTGSKENPNDLDSLRFTTDFRSHTFSLSMTKSVDPAVLFANLGFTDVRSNVENNTIVKQGNSINYGFGMGFSINSALSIGGTYSASYVEDNKVGDTLIVGSGGEPTTFSVSVNYQLGSKARMETSLNIGLNDDASDSTITYSYIYNLRSTRQ